MTDMIGKKFRMETTCSDGSIVRYKVTTVKAGDQPETVWVEFPKRALSIPFPPNNGKRYGLFRVSDLVE
jgi:hypothetical protein